MSRSPRLRPHVVALAAAAAVGGFAASPVQAATCTWNSAAGNWSDPAAWSCGVVPGGADSASVGAAKTVTINSSQSILNLSNAGNVNIDAYLLTLAGGGSTTNTGIINVGAGPNPNNAALQVGPGHNINNAGGVINISADSVLNQFGSTISGGTLNTTGSGALMAFSSGSNVLDNVKLGGLLDVQTNANGRERIANGFTLNGSANVGNGGILSLDSSLTSGGNQTIAGNATFNLNDAGARLAIEGTGSTTLASTVVVRGQGNFGQAYNVGGNNVLTSNGLISADVAGGTLNIVAPGNAGSFVNNGTLQAINGATLLLSTHIQNNAGSQIIAGAGSQVVQNGVTLNGVIKVSGGGVLTTASNGNNVLNAVTLNGALDVQAIANGRERIANGLTLNGSANVGNGGMLSFDSSITSGGNQTIAGNATFNLNDAGARLSIDGTGSTTLASTVVVRGQGNIGQALNLGGNNVLTNNGLISADVNAKTLNIATPGNAGSFINNGTLQAINGATLLLSTHIQNNAGSQIIAGAGSQVVQNGVTLNGVINVSGGGVLTTSSNGNNMLNAVTLTGALDVQAIANGRERIANGLTLNGSANVGNGGILSFESIGGNQTIAGNATFNLNDAGARLAIEGTGSTTLASTVVVRGQGSIGQAAIVGGNNVLTNNGRISADVAGGTLALVPPANAGSVLNKGVLDARGGGTLAISTHVDNSAGQINAQNASQVVLGGTTIKGGTLGSSGSGVIQATSNGSNFLDGVAINGTLDMSSIANSRARLINTSTLSGAINVANGGILSLDSSASTGNAVALNGTGVIKLNDAGARLSIEGGGSSLLGAGVTVRGQGNIGQPIYVGGNNVLTHNGLISADVAGGTLAINAPANAGSLQGTGTLQVAGGTLALNAGPAQQGKLVIGAAGTLVLPNKLTLSGDYTNLQAGSGNGFDRRAGVSGAGQILAGGDVSQVITGANVTNGNSANATLTINNVRVGANTFNYQIGNAGSTGPTLRGAIQTAANGGNLSDARLSGSGVTAANYNAGGPGGNSGNLSVVFNAASAGALAPLSSQVLNLRSNFDNIADQKLAIVLAGGAAAYNAAVGAATPTPVTIANQRVGGTGSQTLTVANAAAAGSYSEDLRAGFGPNTGAARNNAGSINALLAGASDAATMKVGVDTATAGAKSGTVTLNYQTTGTVGGVSNGLALAGANAPQLINVSGNVYQAASGAIQSAALNFGNVQVGDSVTRNLVIRNTASGAGGYVEDLNASFATGVGTDARITGAGSLNGILAGQNSSGANGTMTVAINTAAAGAVNGSIRVNYATAGAVGGVSNGLGTAAAGFEDYAAAGTIVQGNVIDQAKPVINGIANPGAVTVNLGNVRIGAAANQTLAVHNQASGNQQAFLNASIAGNGAPVTAAGSFSGLAAGGSSNALQVGIDTSVAGARSGSATVSLVSDISAYGNCAPNCALNLPKQTVNVNASVFRLATGSSSPVPVNLGAFRVGINAPAAASVGVTHTAAADGYSEQLGIGSVNSGNALFTASNALGSGRVNAGASAAVAISVGAGAGLVAGINTGTVTVQFVSDGTASGTGGAINTNSQQFNVSAKGYTPAVAQLSAPATMTFGTVRVGTVVGAQTLTLANVAQATALNDTLKGTLTVAGAGFTGHGASVSGLTAGGAGGALQVGLDTSTAGVKSGNAHLSLASQNPDLADHALGDSQSVALAGTVNALAQAGFSKNSGAGNFSCSAGVCTLNFGTLLQGSGTHVDMLQLANTATGPADDLLGGFDFTGFSDFGNSGFGGVSLAAGDTMGGLALSLDTGTLGSFSSSFWFKGFSHNAFQSDYALNAIRFVIAGVVVEQGGGTVPIPGTLALLLAAGLGGLATRRRAARSVAGGVR